MCYIRLLSVLVSEGNCFVVYLKEVLAKTFRHDKHAQLGTTHTEQTHTNQWDCCCCCYRRSAIHLPYYQLSREKCSIQLGSFSCFALQRKEDCSSTANSSEFSEWSRTQIYIALTTNEKGKRNRFILLGRVSDKNFGRLGAIKQNMCHHGGRSHSSKNLDWPVIIIEITFAFSAEERFHQTSPLTLSETNFSFCAIGPDWLVDGGPSGVFVCVHFSHAHQI